MTGARCEMKKHPKVAYGILEDGKTIKLVTLVRELSQAYLTDIQGMELERPLYGNHDHFADLTAAPSTHPTPSNGDIQINDFDKDYSSPLKIDPWDNLLRSMHDPSGVISLNVNEDNIIRTSSIPQNKAETKKLVRTHLTPRQFRDGDWQTSVVNIGGNVQCWLHNGANLLLNQLGYYARKNRKHLYFQLADANDIALADYYRIYHLDDNQRVLLVYLGADYRKAFLFDKGELVDIYPLNISQDLPDPEMIVSRVTLALDNVQQAEPNQTVICGDLSSQLLVDHFNQNDAGTTTLLSYPHLGYDKSKADLFDPTHLAQFALPIALAYKALFPDEQRFTPSNFLPKNLILAQKPLKIAWHGILLAFAVFALTFMATSTYLTGFKRYTKAKEEKRRLDYELAVLKVEAEELNRMRTEMRQFDENIAAVRTVLKGKNPWSEVLDTLNRLFQTKPVSWLTNFKMEGTKLLITGTTTNRRYVIDFAEALPNSRIKKVTASRIHDTAVWNFEISSDLPEVDWVGAIEAEMAEILSKNRLEQEQAVEEAPPANAPVIHQNPAYQQSQTTVAKPLPPIAVKFMPTLSDWQLQTTGEALTDYNAFVSAINAGQRDNCVTLGYNYLEKYEGGRLIPIVRWHLANQLYLQGKYTEAIEAVDPLVRTVDRHYPWGVLLAARIDIARSRTRHQKLYNELLAKYPDHPVRGQVDADLATLGLEVGR